MADGFTFDNSAGQISYGTASGLSFNSDGTLTSTSQLRLPDGSVTTPSLTHQGDLNTGLFFPSAEEVSIAGNGLEIARFDGSTGAGALNLVCGQMYVPTGLAIYTGNGSNNGTVTVNGLMNVNNNKLIVNNTGVKIGNAYYLPATDGTSGQVITTDGAGNASWTTPSGGGGSSGTDPLTYYNMGFI